MRILKQILEQVYKFLLITVSTRQFPYFILISVKSITIALDLCKHLTRATMKPPLRMRAWDAVLKLKSNKPQERKIFRLHNCSNLLKCIFGVPQLRMSYLVLTKSSTWSAISAFRFWVFLSNATFPECVSPSIDDICLVSLNDNALVSINNS